MLFSIVFSILLLTVAAQNSDLVISAQGAVPGGSSAVAQGAGVGGNVDGNAEVIVNDGISASAVTITASGPVTTTPATVQTQVVTVPQTQVIAVPQTQVVVKPAPTQKYYVDPKPRCEDIKNDKCYKIDDYTKCGFCVIDKYPVTGYGCSYVEELVMKKSSNKKNYGYETVLTPLCDCAGSFILKASACPSCDLLLANLLKCAGIKDPKAAGVIEIPEKCLKTVGVTKKQLEKCQLLGAPKPAKKEKYPTQYVTVVPQQQLVQQQLIVVPATSTSTATAQAVGTGAVATASAVATAP